MRLRLTTTERAERRKLTHDAEYFSRRGHELRAARDYAGAAAAFRLAAERFTEAAQIGGTDA